MMEQSLVEATVNCDFFLSARAWKGQVLKERALCISRFPKCPDAASRPARSTRFVGILRSRFVLRTSHRDLER